MISAVKCFRIVKKTTPLSLPHPPPQKKKKKHTHTKHNPSVSILLFSFSQGESLLEEPEDAPSPLIAPEADYLADKLCGEKPGTVSDVTCALSAAWLFFFFPKPSVPLWCSKALRRSSVVNKQ